MIISVFLYKLLLRKIIIPCNFLDDINDAFIIKQKHSQILIRSANLH